ncbi:MAG: FAD-binding oxidoreductase, partial [Planctomycetota bacterium]
MKIYGPNATVTARHDWTDGLASFHVRPDGWNLPEFKPGQFANLSLPLGEDWDAEEGKAVRRAYSIASSPGQETLEFFVRRVDDGELTPRLFDRHVGDRVFLDERVAGHFTLDGALDAEDLVLVGTGTGVAPYRPMIHDGAH